jgi:signal transduction histidine kinase
MTSIAERGSTRTRAVVPALAIPLTACVVTIAVVAPALLGAPVSTRSTALAVFVIGAGILFGLGVSDLVRAQESRFARAVVAAGVLWSLSALAASSEPSLYSVGRVSSWLVEAALVYLLLSYPSGRLTRRTDRTLWAGVLSVLGLLYLPTALVAQHFPSPGVWSLCTSDCPSNAFALGHSTPALVADLVVPLREALAVGLFVGVVVAVTQRRRSAGPLLRRMLGAIVFVAVARAILLGAFFLIRRIAPGSSALDVLMWAYLFSLPAVGLACVAGRLNRRLFAADAMDRLARATRTSSSAAHVSRALARALEDPSLRILHSFPSDSGSWVDESGSPAALPQDGSEQHVTGVASGSWRIAVVHDPALAEEPGLVQTAGSYALTALENDHLIDELQSSLEALAESRLQGIAAEDRERRKIERDLHDGAQQRLIAVRVKLELAAEELEERYPAGAEKVRALGSDIDATIDEVRSFARGIYPSLLVEAGLGGALRSAGRSAALPTTVRADRLDRYPPEVETTVYFSCSEALQNAAKHASGATRVTISVWQDHGLHFRVADDGVGFDVQSTSYGTGLGNVSERLAAVGGTLSVRSGPDQGTTVEGSIPLS